ncbi:TPA: hypothetical protein KON86_002804 [Clostridioides difficile]|nr:hypothetical protein [Clostridioides difficile]HBF4443174.1 hypothetical protein [Clostridioides difficile]HBG1420708.1 hypothetical protein [Clostridioides difficile]
MATARNIINEFYDLDENEKEKVIKELLDFNAKKKLDEILKYRQKIITKSDNY